MRNSHFYLSPLSPESDFYTTNHFPGTVSKSWRQDNLERVSTFPSDWLSTACIYLVLEILLAACQKIAVCPQEQQGSEDICHQKEDASQALC